MIKQAQCRKSAEIKRAVKSDRSEVSTWTIDSVRIFSLTSKMADLISS